LRNRPGFWDTGIAITGHNAAQSQDFGIGKLGSRDFGIPGLQSLAITRLNPGILVLKNWDPGILGSLECNHWLSSDTLSHSILFPSCSI